MSESSKFPRLCILCHLPIATVVESREGRGLAHATELVCIGLLRDRVAKLESQLTRHLRTDRDLIDTVAERLGWLREFKWISDCGEVAEGNDDDAWLTDAGTDELHKHLLKAGYVVMSDRPVHDGVRQPQEYGVQAASLLLQGYGVPNSRWFPIMGDALVHGFLEYVHDFSSFDGIEEASDE